MSIGIVTVSGDTHAYFVATRLASSRHVKCHVFETDLLSREQYFSIRFDGPAILTDALGAKVDIAELGVCWWRRIAKAQTASREIECSRLRDVIDSSCIDGIRGAFTLGFSGNFISDPIRSIIAENKVLQLQAASEMGLRIPKTLVSNNATQIGDFLASLPNEIAVAKALGRTSSIIDAKKMSFKELNLEEAATVPTIYQEYIEGCRHIRTNVFGDQAVSVLIETEMVDWRRQVPNQLQAIDLPTDLERRLVGVLEILGLRMGIFDLEVTSEGEFVFLEVNPQGQFLFAEPLAQIPLTDIFADFLIANHR